ncbi:MAG: CHASE2 domain-containing protein [Terriglobia bacterium]
MEPPLEGSEPTQLMQGKPRQFASRAVQFGRTHRAALLISASIGVVVVALYSAVYLEAQPNAYLRFLGNIELKTLDVRFQLRGRRDPGPAVVIVAIDQKSQDVLGRWPFPRSCFAQAVDFLREAHARVIAFDLNFPQVDDNSALQALRSVRKDYDRLVVQPLQNRAFESELRSREAAADNDKQFAEALSRFDNAVLGYFFITPEETKSQDQKRLKEFLDLLAFQTYPQIIHPEYIQKFEGTEALGISPNLPQFAANAKNFGFFYVDPDPDGTVRREPVVAEFQGNLYPSLDVAAAMAYANNSLDQVKLVLNPSGVERIALGQLAIPADRRGFVQIDFDGGAGTFPTYSLADVVRGKLEPKLFRDRLVLIGTTAIGIGDMVLTPFPRPTIPGVEVRANVPFPGVEVHANMLDDILYQHFIRRGPAEYLTDLAFILLFSVGAGMLINALSPLRATLFLIGSLFGFFWLTYFLFAHYRIWVADFLPMSTLLVTYAGIVSYRYFFEEGAKRKVLSTFSQYMHPALIKQMLNTPGGLRLGGEEEELTALFADIRGFTTLSENLAPAQLVELLNEYLTEMTEIIFKNWGTLDKYIGDAIMAFWGAPYPQTDHALRACRAGLEMLQSLQRLQAGWLSRGVPRLDIGIGINTGTMLVGNMGSKIRKNFTIMGDNVNLASRLEGINRQFGTQLIISESTFLLVKDQVIARELDFIRVKGKMQPVKVYELLSLAADSGRYGDLVSRFEKGLVAYRDGQWSDAIEIFEELVHDHPQDGPSQVFITRCRDLLAQPPEGAWDGVFVMKSK